VRAQQTQLPDPRVPLRPIRTTNKEQELVTKIPATPREFLAAAAREIRERPATLGHLGVVNTVRAIAFEADEQEVGEEALRVLALHLGYGMESHVERDIGRWSRTRPVAAVIYELEQAAAQAVAVSA
jgi:hypothetical protein